VSSWTAAGSDVRSALCLGVRLELLIPLLHSWLAATSSPLGLALRRSRLIVLQERPLHQSSETIFPLPFLVVPTMPVRGRKRLRVKRSLPSIVYTNIVIASLNLLYEPIETYCMYKPTRAQKRVLDRLFSTCASFLRSAASSAPSGESEIKEFLKSDLDNYNRFFAYLTCYTSCGIARASC
jgi:K+-transporting ATPase A subunit